MQTRRQVWEKRRRPRAPARRSAEFGGETNRRGYHHHVYVVELDPRIARFAEVRRVNPDRDPALPCVYVGMTGLLPKERLVNHWRGHKASRWVRAFGRRLMPELFAYLNPMPYEAAAQMERDLAVDLRRHGYTVLGGH